MWEEDFWEDDYSEYDKLIYDLKESLKSGIKQEITDNINDLESQLYEVREFIAERNRYMEEMKTLERKLNESEKSVDKRAKDMRLREFLETFKKPAWVCDYKWVYPKEKCNKCDDKRSIHFFAPSGKEYTESCPFCGEHRMEYYPQEAALIEIKETKHSIPIEQEIQGIHFTFAVPRKYVERELRGEDVFYTDIEILYGGEDFNIAYDIFRTYFRNKEDCQRACDWLNERNKLE